MRKMRRTSHSAMEEEQEQDEENEHEDEEAKNERLRDLDTCVH